MNSASMLVNEDCVEENRNSYVSMVMNAAYDRSNPQAEEVEKDLNPSTPKFYNLLSNVNEPLWDGCKKHTKLSAVTQLLKLKSKFNMNESCYD